MAEKRNKQSQEPQAPKREDQVVEPEQPASPQDPEVQETQEAAPQAGTPDPLQEELERLQTENAALAERNLRLMAEFDNYRKRTQREREAPRP